PGIPLSADLEAAAIAKLGPAPVVAISPLAARTEKTWPLERFVELARRLIQPPTRLVIVGGSEDRPALDAFADLSPIALIGEADLRLVAAMLKRARLFIGNDSGMAHLAAAVGAPTLALFGPTEPRNYAPRGPRVRVVDAPGRRLSNLSVEQVLDAARELSSGPSQAMERP
ncbi:MAG: glycosyltransferase family 9 protein, partial [Alphaproteobacteria bacterium]|nr:glycosyltransferase family 9 protein [Alphaproteobacteria bacterium]